MMLRSERVGVRGTTIARVAPKPNTFGAGHSGSTLFLIFVVASAGLVSLPQGFSIGGVTASAGLTVFYLAGAVVAWLARPILIRDLNSVTGITVCFVAWLVGTAAWTQVPNTLGIQNLLVIAGFTVLFVVAAREQLLRPFLAGTVAKWIPIASMVSGVLYLAGITEGEIGQRVGIVGARGFALFSLLGIACFVARWRSGSRKSLIGALVLLLMVALSLSRLGLLAGALLIGFGFIRPGNMRGQIKAVSGIAIALLVFYAAVTRVPALNDRFFQGDVSLNVGGFVINGEGRSTMWQITWDSAQRHLLLGQGGGSSGRLVYKFTGLEHPHNDYLRILHDYGAVGLFLWVGTLITLGRAMWTRWRRCIAQNGSTVIHQSGFLALLGASMAMVTDNLFSYAFLMGPLGILIGCALASNPPEAARNT